MKVKKIYKSPLGEMLMERDEKGLTGLCFEKAGSEVTDNKTAYDFKETEEWLDRYFSGKDPGELPRLNLSGTDFQMAVWKKLLEIPYGETRTYGSIASEIAAERGLDRMSAQAVGGAVGRNPISIIVPCHRVVGSDGSLTGYAGGIERKSFLLETEKNSEK